MSFMSIKCVCTSCSTFASLAPDQVVQERLIGVYCVNQSTELFRQRYRLTTGAATGIDDDTTFLLRQKVQDVQRIGVAAWAELLQTAE